MRRFSFLAAFLAASPAFAASSHPWCGTTRHGAHDAYWAHREQEARLSPLRAASSAAVAADVGMVAILQDEGDLALQRNFVDLAGLGLEFARSGANYTVSRVDRPVVPGGTPLTLTDDSNVPLALPFAFTFYGTAYTSLFVNSDGNLTFGAGESASTPRSISRFVEGPPRIAPLFADLDPGIAGASVTTQSDGDAFRVTWTSVPQFGRTDKNTFQVTLLRDGRIQFAYDAGLAIAIEQAVVGIAPGKARNGLTAVDMSAAAGATSAGALAEGFREETELDLAAATHKFYRSHRDSFQQIVFFTSQTLVGRRALAFELTVHNTDAGIGDDTDDLSAFFGGAHLESVVMMDALSKWFEDPAILVAGEDNTYSVLGQEVGHRWGAYALFKDGATVSRELLGRDDAHWSFFADTDASYLEGSEIADLGGGAFRTLAPSLRYSPLDQYLMGIRRPEEVPPFFFVRSPAGTATNPGRSPESGVDFTGTRKDVAIGDVIAALGARKPAPGAKPPYRQAFVYVAVGAPADPAQIAKLEAIRAHWVPVFAGSTGGRWSVDNRLQ